MMKGPLAESVRIALADAYPDDPPPSLTKQQRRVLRLVCLGLKNHEIAVDMGLKEPTIKATVSGILRRLGVKSRTEAVARVCQIGVSPRDRREDAALDSLATPCNFDSQSRTLQRFLSLTEREMDVLGMVSQGLSNKEIAFQLGVCERTIKGHMGEILRKLGVDSRTKVVIELSKLRYVACLRRSRAFVSDWHGVRQADATSPECL